MRARSRLKHAAAGLLGSLISRNNDINGYWGPGLLYRDVSHSPHTIDIDLLAGTSEPASDSANIMAGSYVRFLSEALQRQEFEWRELTQASITFQFKAVISGKYVTFACAGDPFICTVTLVTIQGHCATLSGRGRCFPFRQGGFTQRAQVMRNVSLV